MDENQPLNATRSNGTKGTKIVIWNLCREALRYSWSLSEKTDCRTFPTPIEKNNECFEVYTCQKCSKQQRKHDKKG
jgi:hypothetical protein